MISALFLLILGHYVADFGLQTEFTATMKGKVHSDPHGIHALIAHSSIHGAVTAAVLLALHLPWALPALVIVIAHGVIDYLKANRSSFGVHVDQTLHLASLIVVWLLAVNL